MTTSRAQYQPFQKFVPFVKVDESTHEAYGIATAEYVDKDGEELDYERSKPNFVKWSMEAYSSTVAAGQDPSFGNIRLQHSTQIAGKATRIDYRDTEKQIWIAASPVNDEIWDMLSGGYLTGYSIAGRYDRRYCKVCNQDLPGSGNWCPKCQRVVTVRYVCTPTETSFVDNPCLELAHFTYVKSDGSQVKKFFQKKGNGTMKNRLRTAGNIHRKIAEECERSSNADLVRIAKHHRDLAEVYHDAAGDIGDGTKAAGFDSNTDRGYHDAYDRSGGLLKAIRNLK